MPNGALQLSFLRDIKTDFFTFSLSIKYDEEWKHAGVVHTRIRRDSFTNVKLDGMV